MSIPVDVADLPATLGDFGTGYLLTTSPAGSVKAVSVRVESTGGVLLVQAPGRGSCANVVTRPTVTLLFAPAQAGGMTLLVDGTATVAEGSADMVVRPTGAVLHRAAP